MGFINDILCNERLYWSLGVILGGILLYFIISRIIDKMLRRKIKHARVERRRTTYIKMAKSITRYAIIIIVILLLLQINGVNVGSLLAGLGIATLIAGLALQDAFKDIIMGFNLMVDDYFAVGDVIEYEKRRGVVLELGLKVTKIRDLDTGGILTIANRQIAEAFVVSHQMSMNFALSYEQSMQEIDEAFAIVAEEIAKIPEIESISYKGINKLDDSAINYLLDLVTKPELQNQVRRDVLKIVKQVFDERKIEFAYPHLTIQEQAKKR